MYQLGQFRKFVHVHSLAFVVHPKSQATLAPQSFKVLWCASPSLRQLAFLTQTELYVPRSSLASTRALRFQYFVPFV